MAAVAAIAGLLFAPACAHAGTVEVTYIPSSSRYVSERYEVKYAAAPGEVNRVRVEPSDRAVRITDPAGVRPGPGCERDEQTAESVVCEGVTGYVRITVSVGDGDDDAEVAPDWRQAVSLSGGEGDDRLSGGAMYDFLDGGAGRDTLVGGDGDDHLDGGPDADHLLGGDGEDDAEYADRTAPVTVLLDGEAGDGEAGEGDHVAADVEGAIGGSGADRLVGNDVGNELEGRAGGDTLVGAGGTDRIDGGPGANRLDGGDGSDNLYVGFGRNAPSTVLGGAGDDSLRGSAAADELDGGPGSDGIGGGGGRDLITARDGERDEIGCRRRERVRAVRVDALDYTFGCRPVRRAGAAAASVLDLGPLLEDTETPGSVTLRIGCPDDARPACTGTITILHRGAGAGRRRFRVRASGWRELETPLRGPARDELRRNGSIDIVFVLRTRDSAGAVRRERHPYRHVLFCGLRCPREPGEPYFRQRRRVL